MRREQILGKWKSIVYMNRMGLSEKYDRQELTFRSDGTGNMHARTLFKRNTSFTWEFDDDEFIIYDLGGPGAVAYGEVEGDELGVVDGILLVVYKRV